MANFTPISAAIGGTLIGFSAVLLMMLNGRIAGVTGVFAGLIDPTGGDRAWLEKVRPWWGHDYHFHVRLRCPGDSPECKSQPPPGGPVDKELPPPQDFSPQKGKLITVFKRLPR